jgi:hypothetical protein
VKFPELQPNYRPVNGAFSTAPGIYMYAGRRGIPGRH